MPSLSRDDLFDFAAFTRAYPHTGPGLMTDAFLSLRRLGKEAHSYAERLCNVGERKEGEYDRKIDSITRRVYAALSSLGGTREIEVEIHGDPRGSCLQIVIPRDSADALRLRF